MKQDPFEDLRDLEFMESRIPALDALSVFVPEGEEPSESVKEALDRIGFSRWYPVPGGYRLLLLYESGDYDAAVFAVEEGGWDHETCKVCRARIPSMTLCWITKDDPYIVLCTDCKVRMGEE